MTEKTKPSDKSPLEKFAEIQKRPEVTKGFLFLQNETGDANDALRRGEALITNFKEKFMLKETREIPFKALSEAFVIFPVISCRKGEKGELFDERFVHFCNPVFVGDFVQAADDLDAEDWGGMDQGGLIDAISASLRGEGEADYNKRRPRAFTCRKTPGKDKGEFVLRIFNGT
jgi:hypothetical protein